MINITLKIRIIPLLFSFLLLGGHPVSHAKDTSAIPAKEIKDTWVLDGEAEIAVVGKYELKLSTSKNKQMTIWRPKVYEGPVEVQFDCLIPAVKTKLLLLVYGHGSDGTPVWEWERDGSYDNYNAGPMEVYTIGFNRGAHTFRKYGDDFVNVRRIGGPESAIYTKANFKRHKKIDFKEGRAFWQQWNTHSLLAAAREPVSGLGKYFHYAIIVEPPHIRLEVEGIPFADIVDHRPHPLQRGSIGFRCMSLGKTFFIKNLIIKGRPVSSKTP